MKKYCTFFCSLIFLVLSGMYVSCSGEDSGDTPEPAPEPAPEITIPTGGDQVPVITDAGGEVTLKFASATNWTLTTGTDWVKAQVSAGKGGNQTVILTVLPNETPDERRAVVTIQSGSVKRTITITQKQKDALTLTVREQEIDATGASFSIKVKSNIEFEVRISDETWIHRIENRALETHTLSFRVDRNESADERAGEIVISGNGLKETFTIRQKGEISDEPEKPVLDVSEKNFSLKADGGLIAFDVESNLEYDIEVGADWILQDAAQSTGKHLVFMAKANTSTESRQATITISGGGLVQTVTVKQKGQEVKPEEPVLNVSQTDFSVKAEGGTISFSVESNGEYRVTIQDGWVKQITSKALSTDNLSFTVDANTATESRLSTVTLSNGELTRVVTIKQEGESAVLIVAENGVEVEASGGNFELNIQSNVEYTVHSSATWLRQAAGRTVTHKSVPFVVDANTSTESRQATITVSGGGLTRTVIITQKGKVEEKPDGPTTGGTEDFKEEQENW